MAKRTVKEFLKLATEQVERMREDLLDEDEVDASEVRADLTEVVWALREAESLMEMSGRAVRSVFGP